MDILLCYACLLFLAVIELSAACCEEDNEETWSYHGSENNAIIWPLLFPTCNMEMQSPIDIEAQKVKRDRSIKPLQYFGYDSPIKRAKIVNNGRTVEIKPLDSIRRGMTAQGKKYNLQQLHFHWGSQTHPGGEHMFDGRRYEMEAHFVHQSVDNVTAVVGVLVQMVEDRNRAFRPIVEVLNDVLYKGEYRELESILDLKQLLPESPSFFYGYTGSLTTPPCTEGVAWFVLQNIQTIGRIQLNHFLRIFSVARNDTSCALAPNNRPPQNLKGRAIHAPVSY